MVPRARELHAKLGDKVDFLLLYTLEAHADDEWPINNAQFTHDGEPVHVAQSETMKDRRELANSFVRDYKINFPVLIDSMQNDFEGVFASWPTRYYIVRGAKLMYKAQPEGGDGSEFSLESLEAALEKCLEDSS